MSSREMHLRNVLYLFFLFDFGGWVEGLSFEAVLSQILCWFSTWYVDEGELEVMILLPAFASAGSAASTTEPTEIAVHNQVCGCDEQLVIPAPGRSNWKPRLCSTVISKQLLTKAVQWCK